VVCLLRDKCMHNSGKLKSTLAEEGPQLQLYKPTTGNFRIEINFLYGNLIIQKLWEFLVLIMIEEAHEIYGPANDPGPQMIPVPQMIPKLYRKWSRDRNWLHRKKLGMAWTPWKVYEWIHIFLIILGEEKTSTSGIKVGIENVSQTSQNTKWTCVDCINFSFRKRTAKRNMNLRRCLCHLINRLELFPVNFLYLHPR